MRPRQIAVIVVAVGCLFAPASASAFTAFRSPSGNIGCYLAASSARCDIRDRDWSPPPRPRSCPVDFGQGASITRRGTRGRLVCAGDTALNSGRVLAYGRKLRAGGITCTSRVAGMTCANRRGHGFTISRQRYRLF